MALIDHVSDSDSDSSEPVDLIQTPEKKENTVGPSLPGSALSHRFRLTQASSSEQPRARTSTSEEKRIAVMVQGPSKPWEYQVYVEDNTVDTVLAEVERSGGDIWYTVEYEDGRVEDVSFGNLLKLRNGSNALDLYTHKDEHDQSVSSMTDSQVDRSNAELDLSSSNGKRSRTKTKNPGFVDFTAGSLTSDDDEMRGNQYIVKKRRLDKSRSNRLSSRAVHNDDVSESESDASSTAPIRTSSRSKRSSKPKLKLLFNARKNDDFDELANDVQSGSDGSGAGFYKPRRQSQLVKTRQGRPKGKRGRPRKVEESESSPERPLPTRKSGRDRGVLKSMKERDMDEEMYADEVFVVNQDPKIISIREIYQQVSKKSPFYLFHSRQCDICGGFGSNSNKGPSPLVHCQGCSISIHKVCLGYRSGRDHMVTKVGHENFVMQCRRCIGIASKKDPSAPRLDTCQGCKTPGLSCAAFSPKRTSKQEEKLREENNGDDPIAEVSSHLVNNAENVLFRCEECRRAWHFEHLPPLDDESDVPEDDEELRETRLKEYSQGQCKDCAAIPGKVHRLVAWRPADRESYKISETVNMLREDQKEYLIKWADKSYFKCTWMPGGWVWGVTAVAMRNAFVRRDDGIANKFPKWTSEEAIPEEYLRMEIIFDVKYDGYSSRSENSDKKHISDVEKVLVKFIGLGYEEAVWEEPPSTDDTDRWSDFVAAYDEYLAGKYFKQESVTVIKQRINDFQSPNFTKRIFLKEQPSALVGGEIMEYQKDGMNWLLFNFHKKKNVILADEMGLGKTIQIIAFIAALVTHKPKCWPFLVVTPNSTCPNWRREIKKWAPDIRVVAYYGGKEARNMAMQYELYPDGPSDMKAHVVVTSYEGPVQEAAFFKRVKWAGMIVDEGQRLKNDENLLYAALKAMKTPFQVLLTGTPLQNNKRELFNLLQFVDSSLDAAKMDAEYEVLTNMNLPKLHEKIRPYFLRRTKLEVLKFLPPMAQVILPVTMSIVQKKLYKSILSKSPELIASILAQDKKVLKPKERGNLNNVLMQLRKCLCHPFLYNENIEERSVDNAALHRNLIDASAKFKLLEIMLPKLRERGHRVLLFSQFLGQLNLVEDFLSALNLPYQRLDGKIGSLEKQRRIDAFNAPGSELFAFLLSTRAGGVGINLATADTVIIMDPDFNPHQDIQALSRAHRIGQKNKVLVFQLMTKGSAEERMVQIGRKKMALDQALIENMDAEDDAGVDLESILKYGAEALFTDDDSNDIRYDSTSVDKLLDRTQVEQTETSNDKTAESQFSFARVWANEKAALTEDLGDADSEAIPDLSVWEKIIEEREAEAAAERARNVEVLGRGKRARGAVDYRKGTPTLGEDLIDDPIPQKTRKRRVPDISGSDRDFGSGDTEGDDYSDGVIEPVDPQELQSKEEGEHSRSKFINQGTKGKSSINSLKNPQKLAPSSRKPGTTTLRFDAKSAKVQPGTQISKTVVKKPVNGSKAQPRMGTAAKRNAVAVTQPILKNTTSYGKKHTVQIGGRTATPNASKNIQAATATQNRAGKSGQKQLAQVSGLPAKPNNVTNGQVVPTRPNRAIDTGRKHSVEISGQPTIQRTSSKAQGVPMMPISLARLAVSVIGVQSSQKHSSKISHGSSFKEQNGSVDTHSQPHSMIRNVANGGKSAPQLANLMQNIQTLNATPISKNPGSLQADIDNNQPWTFKNMAMETSRTQNTPTTPQLPYLPLYSSSGMTSPVIDGTPNSPMSPRQFRIHLEERRAQVGIQFSMKMEIDVMKVEMIRNFRNPIKPRKPSQATPIATKTDMDSR